MRPGVPAFVRGRGRPIRAALLVGALAAGCGPGEPPHHATPIPGDFFVAGYHPWWAEEGWREYPADLLDQLFFFEVELDVRGGIADPHGWPGRWASLVAAMADREVRVIPAVTLHGPGAFAELFASPERTRRAVAELVAFVARTPVVRGLHLDLEVFEPVPPEARDGYTAFVAELDRSLAGLDPGLGLSAFLLAFDDADAYNEQALAALADFVVVQGYDLHHLDDVRAGPLAALQGWGRLNWAAVLARYDALGIPRDRLVFSVPLYGYEWPTDSDSLGASTRDTGVIVPLSGPPDVLPGSPRVEERVAVHGRRRDPSSGAPYYLYRDESGGWVQGWYEDRESLAAKYRFAREQGLAGVAFFPLAYGDPAIWDGLREFLDRPGA